MTSLLKQKVFNGSLWSLIGSSGNQIFGLIVFIVLSHQLSPTDFGLVAIALIAIELAGPLVNFGLTQVLVKEKKLDELMKTTVFWITACLGACASLGIYGFSDFIAAIFAESAVSDLLKFLAILPFLYGLSSVHNGLLERDFRFKEIATRRLAVSVVGGMLAIVLALNGSGIYSLIFQRIFSSVLNLILLWSVVKWRPSFSFSMSNAKRLSSIGIHLMGSTFLVTANNQVRDSIIGYFLGPAALGYLRVTGKLHDFVVQFTISPLVNVAFATFTSLQDDKKKLTKTYRRITQICGLLTFPSFLGLAVVAPELIIFVFGEKWAPSGLLMQILCIASLSSTLNYFFKPLMVTLDRSPLILQITLIDLIIMAITTAITAQYSLTMVVAGMVFYSSVSTVIRVFFIWKYLGIKVVDLFEDYIPPIVSSILMVIALLSLKSSIEMYFSQFWIISVVVFCGTAIYFITLYIIFPRYTRGIQEAILPTMFIKLRK